MTDASHVRSALARFDQVKDVREAEIAKVPVSNGCHCGLDPQSMHLNSWMPGQARHDMGTSEISASLSDAKRDTAFKNIQAAARHFGIDMAETSWKELGKQAQTKNPACS